MRLLPLGLSVIALAMSCRASGGREKVSPAARASAAAAARKQAARVPATPAVQRACARDDECAVARLETAGEHACCPSCATTPGTRKWHAALQKHCAERMATNCSPLACPEGPTVAVCRNGVCEATATGADGGPARVGVERRCMPSMVCDVWVGCAEVVGNGQDGWFVEQSSRVPRGEIASIESVCTGGEKCEAARVFPPEVVCAPHTTPPSISPPPYTCSSEGGQCKATEKR